MAILIPYNISFGVYDTIPNFIIFTIDFILLADIFISMNSGYQTKGMLVMQRHKIVLRYLKSWFIPDFLASCPIFLFFYLAIGDDIYEPFDNLIR